MKMKSMKLLSTLLITIALTAPAAAQILEEKTAVVNERLGEQKLFELNTGEEVYSYADEDGWYKIRKVIYLEPGNLPGKTLPAGTELQDEDGRAIGKTLRDVELQESDTLDPFRGDDRLTGVVEGYVFKTKIEENSIPEKVLQSALNEDDYRKKRKMMEDLTEQFDFEEEDFDNLSVRVLREENKTISAEKDFRMILVYRGSRMYAVITNGHEVTAPKIKAEEHDRPFHTIYFYNPTDDQKELMEEILYTYLAL